MVGPQRAEIQQLQSQVEQLQQQLQSGQGQQQQGLDINGVIDNLFPGADSKDEYVRSHANAHVIAANMLGQKINEAMIEPLKGQIADLQKQVAAAGVRANSSLPAEQFDKLSQEFPSLLNPDFPQAERQAILERMSNQGSRQAPRSRQAGPPMPSPYEYVEDGGAAAGPSAGANEAALNAFDKMDTSQQEFALGQMLAERGARSLGM